MSKNQKKGVNSPQPKQGKEKADAGAAGKKGGAEAAPPVAAAPSPGPKDDKKYRAQADALLALLECPICFGDLTSPIYQCTSGHVLCASCKAKVERCPACQEVFGQNKLARNLHLERLAQTVEVCCKYPGCGAMLPLADRHSHEGACSHRPWSCPENWKECKGWLGTWDEEPQCTWAGEAEDLVAHYRSKHAKQKRFDDWKANTFGYTFELCAEEDVASTDICQTQPVLISHSRFVWISLSQSANHLSIFAVKIGEPRIPGETYTMRVTQGEHVLSATLPLYSVREAMESVACPDWEITRRMAVRLAANNKIRFEFIFADQQQPAAPAAAGKTDGAAQP